MKGGKVMDIFGSGRHTLITANIPLLSAAINLPFGGQSPFAAEVWYVNKAHDLDVRWGTPTPIQVQDPKYGVFVSLRSNGTFGFYVEDTREFLTGLVGTLTSFDRQTVARYFRGLVVSEVKDAIAKYIAQRNMSVLEINSAIDELSQFLEAQVRPVMARYGVGLSMFYVNDISMADDDPAVQQLKAALAKRADMDLLGYTYQQERTYDVLQSAASNTGSDASSLMGVGMGLGMGLGVGGPLGGVFGDMTRQLVTGGEPAGGSATEATPGSAGPGAAGTTCPRCGAPAAGNAKFCSNCGAPLGMVCPQCAHAVGSDDAFCSNCGARLGVSGSSQPSQPKEI